MRARHLLAALAALTPDLVLAVERGVESPLNADRLLQLGMGLVVVIALIGATAFVLKRVLRVPTGTDGPVRVLGGVSMGPRERVVLLEAAGERLLIGVVPGRIQTLHVLGADAGSASGAVVPPFERALADASAGSGR